MNCRVPDEHCRELKERRNMEINSRVRVVCARDENTQANCLSGPSSEQ